MKHHPSLHQQLFETAQAVMQYAKNNKNEDAVILKSVFTNCHGNLEKQFCSDEKEAKKPTFFKPNPELLTKPQKKSLPTPIESKTQSNIEDNNKDDDYEESELRQGWLLAEKRKTGADYTTIISQDAPIYQKK